MIKFSVKIFSALLLLGSIGYAGAQTVTSEVPYVLLPAPIAIPATPVYLPPPPTPGVTRVITDSLGVPVPVVAPTVAQPAPTGVQLRAPSAPQQPRIPSFSEGVLYSPAQSLTAERLKQSRTAAQRPTHNFILKNTSAKEVDITDYDLELDIPAFPKTGIPAFSNLAGTGAQVQDYGVGLGRILPGQTAKIPFAVYARSGATGIANLKFTVSAKQLKGPMIFYKAFNLKNAIWMAPALAKKDPCEDWMIKAINHLFENGKVPGRGPVIPLTDEQKAFLKKISQLDEKDAMFKLKDVLGIDIKDLDLEKMAPMNLLYTLTDLMSQYTEAADPEGLKLLEGEKLPGEEIIPGGGVTLTRVPEDVAKAIKNVTKNEVVDGVPVPKEKAKKLADLLGLVLSYWPKEYLSGDPLAAHPVVTDTLWEDPRGVSGKRRSDQETRVLQPPPTRSLSGISSIISDALKKDFIEGSNQSGPRLTGAVIGPKDGKGPSTVEIIPLPGGNKFPNLNKALDQVVGAVAKHNKAFNEDPWISDRDKEPCVDALKKARERIKQLAAEGKMKQGLADALLEAGFGEVPDTAKFIK